MEKLNRLDALRVILSNHSAATQNDILAELRTAGFKVSQATLSADLQKLHAAKMKTRRGYQYVLPRETLYQRPVPPASLPEYLQATGVQSVAFSGTLMVLKTRPGYAAGLAADIDAHRLAAVAGTVAGYDTLFVAQAEGVERQQLVDELAQVLPALKSVLL